MTQSVIIQIGQCGNQIGYQFWNAALKEHMHVLKNSTTKGWEYDSIDSFFEASDGCVEQKGIATNDFQETVTEHEFQKLVKSQGPQKMLGRTKQASSRGPFSSKLESKRETSTLKQRDAQSPKTSKTITKHNLRARAVLIDMEEGVLNEILNSKLGPLFKNTEQIRDVSGAGNNWAVGHLEYGRKYADNISDAIRKTTEACDSLQCFFCLHSMGGGTGSGLGTFVLNLLSDEYPEIFRFVTAVYPSVNDDVITSPYNSLLAMHQLTETADCVLPIDNQALINILQRAKKAAPYEEARTKAFEEMNSIVANLILDMTSSSRFQGSLNVDLNEISMNLVPFPKIHYLTASMTPIPLNASRITPSFSSRSHSTIATHFQYRHLNHMFNDVFSPHNQLLQVDPMQNLYLGCSLMVRGNTIEISDVRQNIDRLRPNLKFIHWNQEGWKVGLCQVPPLNKSCSLLALANNTCFKDTCTGIKYQFMKLYRRKAHMHHYTTVDGFENSHFDEALESLNYLLSEYNHMENSNSNADPMISRLRIAS